MSAVALTLVVGWAAIGLSSLILHRFQVFDVPNARSSHGVAVVRGGGIGIGIAIAVGLSATANLQDIDGFVGFVVAMFGFALIGLAEDLRRDQPVALRLAAQLLVGTLAAIALLDGSGSDVAVIIALAAVTMVWLVGFANVFNFMDGINGISGVTAGLIAATVCGLAVLADDTAVAVVAAVVAAAAASFLPYNLPHARLFMGDVGSYLLGAGLAALLVLGLRSDISGLALLAPYAPYLADSSVTLGRRLVRGERWWEPHRQHVYQQLVDSGWSHLRTTLWIGVITAACGAAAVIGVWLGGVGPAIGPAIAGGAAGTYLASPRWLASHRPP